MEINKIHCMDCLEGMDRLRKDSVNLIVIDPPYGIDYQSARRDCKERFDKLKNDGIPNTSFIPSIFKLLKDDGALYIFTRWDVYSIWESAIRYVGFKIKNVIIWDRMVHGLGDLKGSYAPQHDFIIFAVKGRHILKNGRPKDVIRCKRPDIDKMIHPTEKPIDLIRQLISNSSNEGDLVLDCFIGSGTTAVACKQLNRNFIGFEINPEYVKVANKRLEQENIRKWG